MAGDVFGKFTAGAGWLLLALAIVALVAAVPLAFYGTHLYLGIDWFFTAVVVVNAAVACAVLGIAAAFSHLGNPVAAAAIFVYRGLLLALLLLAAVYGAYRLVAG